MKIIYHKCKNDNLEKLRPTPIPYFHPQFIGYQEAKKIHFPPFKKRGSELWINIMGSIPSLPPSIWQIVLKCTQTSESVISQLLRTQTKSYGLDELGITPEFTVYIRVS